MGYATQNKRHNEMEEWKDIPGYEGIYQVSTEGRIRTVDGKTTYSERHGERHWKSRILKWRGHQPSGGRVNLWKDGKCKDYLVHRLIALTFLGNAPIDMTVNHKNGDRFDNRIENLEWMSRGDNIRYGFANRQYERNMKQVTLHGDNKTITFKSMSECSRYLGRSNGYVSYAIKNGRDCISASGDIFRPIPTRKEATT